MTGDRGDDLVLSAHEDEGCGEQLVHTQAKTSRTVRGGGFHIIGHDDRLDEGLKLRATVALGGTGGDVSQLRFDLLDAPPDLVPVSIDEGTSETGEPDHLGVGARPPQQLRIRRANGQRDPALNGPRLAQPGISHAQVRIIDADGLAVQEIPHGPRDSQASLDPTTNIGPVAPNSAPFRRGVASTETKTRATLGDHVKGGDVRREQDRITNPGVADVGPQPDGRGDRRGRGQSHERRGTRTRVISGE